MHYSGMEFNLFHDAYIYTSVHINNPDKIECLSFNIQANSMVFINGEMHH